MIYIESPSINEILKLQANMFTLIDAQSGEIIAQNCVVKKGQPGEIAVFANERQFDIHINNITKMSDEYYGQLVLYIY